MVAAAEKTKTGLEAKYVTLPDGIKVRYVEAGPSDAPVVLLAHGFLGSLNDWRYNIEPLAVNRRVIAFDWVGFGQSDKRTTGYSLFYFADFLRDFAEALGLKSFDLVGHSMGGKHACAFVILHPGYVRKLILVDTDGFLPDSWFINLTKRWYFQPLSKLTTKMLGSPRFLKASVKNIYYGTQFHPSKEEIAAQAAEYRQSDYKESLQALNYDFNQLSFIKTGLRDRTHEIQVPTLIIWGLQDKILKLENGRLAEKLIPNSHMLVFDKCGHLPQIEHPASFNQLVDYYLNLPC